MSFYLFIYVCFFVCPREVNTHTCFHCAITFLMQSVKLLESSSSIVSFFSSRNSRLTILKDFLDVSCQGLVVCVGLWIICISHPIISLGAHSSYGGDIRGPTPRCDTSTPQCHS